MKTLRVCLAGELPLILDRDPNFIYFLYDKLTVFVGQNMYNDNYAIVEQIPENPINGMLYFCLDGYVRALIDHSIIDIAKIENNNQLEALKNTGTTFLVNSERRYLDLQRRIITLPFQNGTYELTVSLANDLLVDKDTVVAYNEKTNQFEISGKRQDFDLVFTDGYYGKDTKSASINVENNTIKTNIKISSAYDNILKIISDGLYVNVKDRVTTDQFNNWKSQYENYKEKIDTFISILSNEVESAQNIISEESVSKRILKALEEKYPDIEEALNKLNNMSSQFEGIESRCIEYTDEHFNSAYTKLNNSIQTAVNDPWEEF